MLPYNTFHQAGSDGQYSIHVSNQTDKVSCINQIHLGSRQQNSLGAPHFMDRKRAYIRCTFDLSVLTLY